MKFSLFLSIPLFAGLAFGQAAPTAPPGDNPTNQNVYMGKLPKIDKSKLRDLKGLVKDDNGNPIDGAIVSLKDLKTGKIQSFRTQKDGSYLFYDLNIDLDYELTAKFDGAAGPVTKKLTKYDNRKRPTLDFQLEKKKAA
jgi:hypothetical protein